MPLPTELEGKELIGSTWIRRMGKHRGFRWRITGFNDAGVKLEPEKSNAKGQHPHAVQSIQWPMFMNLYQSEGKLDMIVKIDKEGYVQSVEREPSVVKNGVAETPKVPEIEYRICKGPWHYSQGKGTSLPADQFSIVKFGRNSGKIALTCDKCRTKRENTRYPTERVKFNVLPAITTSAVVAQEQALVIPTYHAPASTPLKKWKVTIIKQTEVIVEAHDYLDAGVAAGDGEVISIERL